VDAYAGFLFDQPTAEEAYRAVARFMVEGDERDPGWTPLLSEFMVHASRHEALRRQVVESRERFLDAIAGLIERLCAKHDVEFRLPAKEIARGSGAIARGLFVERLMSPGSVSPELFEEVHVAYMRGLAVPTHERSTR
jgi:hypothetical protein